MRSGNLLRMRAADPIASPCLPLPLPAPASQEDQRRAGLAQLHAERELQRRLAHTDTHSISLPSHSLAQAGATQQEEEKC